MGFPVQQKSWPVPLICAQVTDELLFLTIVYKRILFNVKKKIGLNF